MFVHDGKIDWDGVIVAEARRRKFLELHSEAATNQDPVLFRISIIPWWAWLMRSYLLEAKLINGRAAMVGFFMAYLVDALTGLDVVGQTGNFICKAGLFVTVISVMRLPSMTSSGKHHGKTKLLELERKFTLLPCINLFFHCVTKS
uniref:Uncharacterized protein n=2 Tax=Quercus lobata TaxID=97700 RepID=A0A7N2MJK4_QUELO